MKTFLVAALLVLILALVASSVQPPVAIPDLFLIPQECIAIAQFSKPVGFACVVSHWCWWLLNLMSQCKDFWFVCHDLFHG
jgi:hypothetical protein